jgi:hypothetical protein
VELRRWRGSTAEPALLGPRHARGAGAPVFGSHVGQHLFDVESAPLPGRPTALLARRCSTHTPHGTRPTGPDTYLLIIGFGAHAGTAAGDQFGSAPSATTPRGIFVRAELPFSPCRTALGTSTTKSQNRTDEHPTVRPRCPARGSGRRPAGVSPCGSSSSEVWPVACRLPPVCAG